LLWDREEATMLDAWMDPPDRVRPRPGAEALVRIDHPRPVPRWERAVHRAAAAAISARRLRGLGVATALAFALWLVGLPWAAPLAFGVGLAHYAGAVIGATVRAGRTERARGALAQPLRPEIDPAEITSIDLRAAYLDILRVHEDIRRSLLDAERMQSTLRALFGQCGDVVQVAGRLARLANPLHDYLEVHGANQAKQELHRLAVTADGTSDRVAQAVYQSAAAARGRQLGTLLEIQQLRDRIRARLELIGASLASVQALVIKLQVLDLEKVAVAGESMSDQLASLGEELVVLESMIEDD
jgi:hypothetical protein